MALEMPLRLIVGLGNPGPEYSNTRHNAGFWLVDALCLQAKGQWHYESRFHGDAARIMVDNQALYLLKPMTFMNQSGWSVLALAHFYKVSPNEIMVMHDELDLAPGVARFKLSGGHGGHNGLKDIITRLGTHDFLRLRLGIGHPGDRKHVLDFVLKKPCLEELKAIENAMDQALSCLFAAIRGDREGAMKALHTVRKRPL